MGKIRQMLRGRKTYLISLGGALTAVGGYLTGDLGTVELIAALFAALGLSSTRAGIENSINN